jgi:hypothetical protein
MSISTRLPLDEKRGFIASFFISAYLIISMQECMASANIELNNKFDKAHYLAWQNILHAPTGKPLIKDPAFVFTAEKFSLDEEYRQNLSLAMASPEVYFCRFPARYELLMKDVSLPGPKIELCPDLKEFLDRAPVQRASLVFAAEDITSPSSMMGHLMLKIEGKNIDGVDVQHAISYFTEVNTVNVPKLLFDSLFIGKNGYYTLSPYAQKLYRYNVDEQRNVWDYQLKLTRDEMNLLAYHLYELKNTNIKYFFHKYNCATLIYRILAVAKGSSVEASDFWVTPSDVVRLVVNNNLVEKTLFYPSNAGRIKIGLDALNNTPGLISQKKLSEWNLAAIEKYDDGQKEIYKFILNGYNGLLSEKGLQKLERYESNKRLINDVLGSGEVTIDVGGYKKPSDAPGDQQFRLGLVNEDEHTYYRFGFLAAGHKLADDNRSYFSENEISLGDLTLGIDPSRKDFFVEEFNLYSAKSYMPFDYFTKGKSGEISIGVKRIKSSDGHENNLFINGGVGYTVRVQPDMDLSAELVSEAGSVGSGYFSIGYKGSLIVREIYSMKTSASISELYGRYGNSEKNKEYLISQSKYLNDRLSLTLGISNNNGRSVSLKRYNFDVIYSF